jgi:polyhydroxybutyrate depolymerase
VVHISSAYDHAKSHPLILDFHGAGVGAEYQTLVDNVMNDTLRLDGRDIITVYGQGTPGLDDFVVWQGAPYSSGANDVSTFA